MYAGRGTVAAVVGGTVTAVVGGAVGAVVGGTVTAVVGGAVGAVVGGAVGLLVGGWVGTVVGGAADAGVLEPGTETLAVDEGTRAEVLDPVPPWALADRPVVVGRRVVLDPARAVVDGDRVTELAVDGPTGPAPNEPSAPVGPVVGAPATDESSDAGPTVVDAAARSSLRWVW